MSNKKTPTVGINSFMNDYASAPQDLLTPGVKVSVKKMVDNEVVVRKAEVMSTRQAATGTTEYYVHFCEFNKRLDEWVPLDRIDLTTIELSGAMSDGKGTPLSSTTSKSSSKAAATSKSQLSKQPDPKRARKGRTSGTSSVLVAPASPSLRSTSVVSAVSSSSDLTTDSTGDALLNQEIETLRRGGSMTQRPEEIARVKNLEFIEMGKFMVNVWYFSPFPEEICRSGTVYICEFCLLYFGSREHLIRHCQKCKCRHPPGTEIYRKDNFSFFELDGHRQKDYCRNLCLLSKLFLDHKTLFYDVDPFLFYVLTENDSRGCHILGYFSKEKDSLDNYNVACILTLPQHQRKGYGKLLIDLSYELSRRENKLGSPEKPLSDLGLLSYRSYWSEVIMSVLYESSDVTIESLAKKTAFTVDDILHTLYALDILRYRKGQHVIVLTEKVIADYERTMKKPRLKFDPSCLQWKPHQWSQSDLRYL